MMSLMHDLHSAQPWVYTNRKRLLIYTWTQLTNLMSYNFSENCKIFIFTKMIMKQACSLQPGEYHMSALFNNMQKVFIRVEIFML